MAYRKKTSRVGRRRTAVRTTRRRRRIGAVSARKQNVMKVVGLIAGAVIPQMLSGKVVFGQTLDPKIVGIGSVVLGFLAPRFVKGDLVEGIGSGLIASGGVLALKEFNILSGIPVIAGWRDMKVINGANPAVGATVDKSNASKLRDFGQSNSFRPSASQMMNGMYNRRPLDGTYD